MKLFFSFYLILFCLSYSTAQIKLEIRGIKANQGQIYIGLYNKAEGFTKIEKTFKNWIIAADQEVIIVELDGIANGQYALSIFQDSNNNGKVDKNRMGLPKEIYGFSNNARRMFSAPTYEECSFIFSDNLKLSVNLY